MLTRILGKRIVLTWEYLLIYNVRYHIEFKYF